MPTVPDETCAHDASHWLKARFRAADIHPLISPSLAQSLLAVFKSHDTNSEQSVEDDQVRASLLLSTCWCRRVLIQELLRFLNMFAKESEFSGMTAKNLAICWAPTLFPIDAGSTVTSSSSIEQNTISKSRELCESTHNVLQKLIERVDELFALPEAGGNGSNIAPDCRPHQESQAQITNPSVLNYRSLMSHCVQISASP